MGEVVDSVSAALSLVQARLLPGLRDEARGPAALRSAAPVKGEWAARALDAGKPAPSSLTETTTVSAIIGKDREILRYLPLRGRLAGRPAKPAEWKVQVPLPLLPWRRQAARVIDQRSERGGLT